MLIVGYKAIAKAIVDLNTSNVNVNQIFYVPATDVEFNLNTSNVNVNLFLVLILPLSLLHLNTSNVNVNLNDMFFFI